MALTARVRAWQERGRGEEFRGYGIHTFRQKAEGPLLLLLHGFPSSSYDWRLLLEEDVPSNVLGFDFLGFGLSDKPRGHDYSLFWQADLSEELVRRHGDGRPVLIVAHDMGTSVANELMARDLEGKLEMEIAGIVLFNGSMVLEAASPTPAQRALRSPLGPLVARLSSERWHGAIREWPGELSLAWGLRDPVATTAVLAALRELRPQVPVSELPELAHYPQLEDPRQIASALRGAFPG